MWFVFLFCIICFLNCIWSIIDDQYKWWKQIKKEIDKMIEEIDD